MGGDGGERVSEEQKTIENGRWLMADSKNVERPTSNFEHRMGKSDDGYSIAWSSGMK